MPFHKTHLTAFPVLVLALSGAFAFGQPIAPNPDLAIYGGGASALNEYARQWDVYNQQQFESLLRQRSFAPEEPSGRSGGLGAALFGVAVVLALIGVVGKLSCAPGRSSSTPDRGARAADSTTT